MLQRETHPVDPVPRDIAREIQVAGLWTFPEYRWREAVLCYLFGVWGGKEEVMRRPKISFGPFTLDQTLGVYYAYSIPEIAVDYSDSLPQGIINAGPGKEEIEIGLIRFVKDNRITSLRLFLSPNGVVNLWKGQRRGQLFVNHYGLPDIEELWKIERGSEMT